MGQSCRSCRAFSGFWSVLLCLSSSQQVSEAFQHLSTTPRSAFVKRNLPTCLSASRRRTIVKEREFDPLCIDTNEEEERVNFMVTERRSKDDTGLRFGTLEKALTSTSVALLSAEPVLAATRELSFGMDPKNFQPVCPASDAFYRFLQYSAESVVGTDSAMEYGPLIAGGLLRVRLELCVVESFFQEAVGPFIAKNGYSWILPLHETVETFIAGTVFAFAATFILIGSTKIITVIVTYSDFLLGFPSRLFGGFFFDRALGKPVTLDIGLGPFKTRLIGPPDEAETKKPDLSEKGPVSFLVIALSGAVKYFGEFLKIIRDVIDSVDIFVGRYLVVWATGYVLIKFLHFKIFPDFPNFDIPF